MAGTDVLRNKISLNVPYGARFFLVHGQATSSASIGTTSLNTPYDARCLLITQRMSWATVISLCLYVPFGARCFFDWLST